MIGLLGGSKIGVSIALVAILLAVVVSSGAIAASSSQPLFARAIRDPGFRTLTNELRTHGHKISMENYTLFRDIVTIEGEEVEVSSIEFLFEGGQLLYIEANEESVAVAELYVLEERWYANGDEFLIIPYAQLKDASMLRWDCMGVCMAAGTAGCMAFCFALLISDPLTSLECSAYCAMGTIAACDILCSIWAGSGDPPPGGGGGNGDHNSIGYCPR